ncbi:hypothetical protein F4680DRAFT_431393 [Xylaria scruposa]|nr:hypothetical protein F4680DRAFT_431393 [Xylaria scruposa]
MHERGSFSRFIYPSCPYCLHVPANRQTDRASPQCFRAILLIGYSVWWPTGWSRMQCDKPHTVTCVLHYGLVSSVVSNCLVGCNVEDLWVKALARVMANHHRHPLLVNATEPSAIYPFLACLITLYLVYLHLRNNFIHTLLGNLSHALRSHSVHIPYSPSFMPFGVGWLPHV